MLDHSDGAATPSILMLAERALTAYNARDVEAFCACFASEVLVLDADGSVVLSGMEEFRERYDELFATSARLRATTACRLQLGRHLVQRTLWERTDSITGETEAGQHLARYTERAGRIAVFVMLP